jgi:hypothetical protein
MNFDRHITLCTFFYWHSIISKILHFYLWLLFRSRKVYCLLICQFFSFITGFGNLFIIWIEYIQLLLFGITGRVRGCGYGRRAAGTRTVDKRVQRVFSKKNVTGPSQTRTRLPAYTRARVRIPRVPDTGTQVQVVPGGF